MKVSIIIPAYNAAATVVETVESALAQTYSNFDVTVVNDGSTDETTQLVQHYPVTLYSKPNGGVANARNAGAAFSSSDALLFLDADDLIDKEYLSKTVPLMVDRVGVVSTSMQRFGEDNTLIHPALSTASSNRMPTCSLVSRAAFNEVGGYDPTMMYEDWDLWLKIRKAGWLVAFIYEPLFRYRLTFTGRNAMQDQDRAKHQEEIRRRHA